MALKITGQLGLDGSGFFSTMNRADAAVQRFSRNVTSGLGARMAGLFTVGAMGLMLRKTIELGGKLTDLSARTGKSVEDLQRFGKAAKDNGSSMETLIGFWEKLAEAREDALKNPNGNAAKAFGALGIGRAGLSGDTNSLTAAIARAVQSSTNVEALVAPLRDVGGRSATELITAFKAGWVDGYQDIKVMSAEQADVMDEIGDRFESLSETMIVSLAPAIISVMNAVDKLAENAVIAGAIIEGVTKKIARGTKGQSPIEMLFPLFGVKGMYDAVKNFRQRLSNNGGSDDIDKSTDENVASIMQMFQEAREAATASRAARIASRRSGGARGIYDAPETRGGRPISDSLVAVGNFLGTGRGLVSQVENRKVALLSEIAKNTRSKPSKDTLGLPPS